ncbi:MAG: DUF1287 domain-containing protein [Candidatus Riflebacteria bacterium HGW-Riflebacteria-2]|jgi:hypothetical protein|nr:MAG: DUF1287 domain-containing protein [Candidatus Riflebacteria bacterium HGW-Riflebacteria-2]
MPIQRRLPICQILCFLLFSLAAFQLLSPVLAQTGKVTENAASATSSTLTDPYAEKLIAAAIERTTHTVRYDGSYRRISYPGGDVPADVGVCTDEIIRVYRALGIDLQKEVHEDMRRHFSLYPKNWGLKKPDTNIDHRRVPNLQTYFTRKGQKLAVSQNGEDYRPGNLVTWMLPGNLPHIGIVTDRRSEDGLRPLIVHNIGAGPVLEDMLFVYKITGHYRYPAEKTRRRRNE